MTLHLTFLGGVGTVTGSRYLLRGPRGSLLVDCGLFQGYKQLRLRNWQPLPVPPTEIDAVVLTHAHLDHSGFVPALVKQGFRGRVYATRTSCELCAILWPDSGHLMEEDAAFANRHGFSKHRPALPLYTEEDARQALAHLEPIEWHRDLEPAPGFAVSCRPAGHILGAASVLVRAQGKHVLFSGDLGRPHDVMMPPPEPPPAADVVLVESTYGDRQHPAVDPLAELGLVLRQTAAHGGVAVVPVFAVGRAQAILHLIVQLKAAGQLPASLPVFLDSPMAIDVTELYQRHCGEHRLSRDQCELLARSATLIRTSEASRALIERHGPMVILAASGMATGGRVLHHLKNYLPDPRTAVVLTGFQAPGTRGALLAAGDREIRIHGDSVPVKAKVVQLQATSAHADGDEVLDWLRRMPAAPKQVYVVHGEPGAADKLRQRIEQQLGWPASVPDYRDTVDC